MKTILIILTLPTLSACAPCGTIQRMVDENPAWLAHPLTGPQLLEEKMRCGE